MVSILRRQEWLPDKEKLKSQMASCLGVTGKEAEYVSSYLINKGMDDLAFVTTEDDIAYRMYVRNDIRITKQQEKHYRSALEQVQLAYMLPGYPELEAQVDKICDSLAKKNKVLIYLIRQGVKKSEDIDYDVRCGYEIYLRWTIAKSKVNEYLKVLDQMKLEIIRIDNLENPLKPRTLRYGNTKIFLLYHLVYEVALSFYFLRDKEELLFDFSINTSGILKRQVFSMLKYVLDNKKDRHDRRERFLIPLKLLYKYCIENNISDVEQMTEADIQGFRESIDGHVGTKTNTYMQEVGNLLKFLFVNARTVNWDANIWYMERFQFKEGRMNPAREIRKISYGQIVIEENRRHFKEYMRYELGVTQKKSIQTIRDRYYGVKEFLKYCDEKTYIVSNVHQEEMKGYIQQLEDKQVQPETYNRSLVAAAMFFGYLLTKGIMEEEPLHVGYYFKTTFPRHNDRTVSIENQLKILKCLNEFPIVLALMYLNLWCVGIRISEVCVIKGGAYTFDGETAWVRIYQQKLKKEKQVPIPTRLYSIMIAYITDNKIREDEFVFKNHKGGAYDAGTFSKQFKRRLSELSIEGYSFKSHDFRHTVATFLMAHGASIEVTRDYLGHKTTDMTMQYLDFMSAVLKKENEAIFEAETDKLSSHVKITRRKASEK